MSELTTNERIGQLQDMCNTYGDFKVAIANKTEDGDMRWTKHKSVMECWETETGVWFLGKANNRQIFQCELVLDLDKDPSLEKLNKICDFLESERTHFKAYFTGSKGYHIHIINAEFLNMDTRLAEQVKSFLIRMFDCDILKSSSKVMIALENVPHWKTGKSKTLLRFY